MPKTLPELILLSSLLRRVRLRPANPCEEESHLSYPIPVPGPQGLLIGFLHMHAAQQESMWFISRPTHVSFWEAEKGTFRELRVLSPEELALSTSQSEWLGTYYTPEQRQRPEFVKKHDEFLSCYGPVLLAFGARLMQVPAETRRAAQQFKTLSPLLLEKPLLPYYRYFGRQFFEWINNLNA